MALRGEAARKTYTGHQPLAADVLVAHHQILGEDCVQKTYRPAGREDAIAFAEPRLLNELDHPNITPLREAQFDPVRTDCVTIVMRVYRGGSVHDAMMRGHRFSVGAASTVLQQMADALHYLHVVKRCVHRDFKPKNVLLDFERVNGFLADFGSAALLDPSTGTSAGIRTTALYQAPEVALTGRFGPPADVYSWGLTAFEMLNGLFPYAALDLAEIDRRVNAGKRALPERMVAAAAFQPHVPRALRALVRSTLSPDPAERPSAAELLRSLRSLACVDWLQVSENGLDGEWSGGWLPNGRPERRIDLSVTSAVLRSGTSRGRRRLTASYRSASSGGWRTVGVAPMTVDDQDVAAVSAFFRQVEACVARRWPA